MSRPLQHGTISITFEEPAYSATYEVKQGIVTMRTDIGTEFAPLGNSASAQREAPLSGQPAPTGVAPDWSRDRFGLPASPGADHCDHDMRHYRRDDDAGTKRHVGQPMDHPARRFHQERRSGGVGTARRSACCRHASRSDRTSIICAWRAMISLSDAPTFWAIARSSSCVALNLISSAPI